MYSMVMDMARDAMESAISARRLRSAQNPRAAALEHETPCLLLAHFLELGKTSRRQPPGIAELIEAQRALDTTNASFATRSRYFT